MRYIGGTPERAIGTTLLKPRIYLDHAATTPMRPEAAAAVAQGMAVWANPSSPHAEGRAARAALEDARGRIAAALGWTGEVILTSGASEALQIALGRAKGARRLISAVEHDAVFRAAPNAEVLPITDATVDRAALQAALVDGPAIVAIQHLNSETGTLQPLEELASVIRASGGILVADCAQSAGKMELPDADMIVISAHKLGGPPGIGALLVRDLSCLDASGGQEKGYRGGTENLPGALGFAAALERSSEVGDWDKRDMLDALDRFEWFVRGAGGELILPDVERNVTIASVAMPGMSAAAQLVRFDQAGFAVSAGSACASGVLKRSRALAAFGISEEIAARTIRISVGWTTSAEDLQSFTVAWLRLAEEAKARAA